MTDPLKNGIDHVLRLLTKREDGFIVHDNKIPYELTVDSVCPFCIRNLEESHLLYRQAFIHNRENMKTKINGRQLEFNVQVSTCFITHEFKELK